MEKMGKWQERMGGPGRRSGKAQLGRNLCVTEIPHFCGDGFHARNENPLSL